MKKLIASKVFNKTFTLKHLEELYESDIRFNTATGIDRMNKEVFDRKKVEHFQIIKRKVMGGTYKFTYYKEKLILKNRSSNPRVISIPTIRDKIVLKGIHELLKYTFEIQQPLVQVVINQLKQKINNYDSYIKIDLQDFYGSLNHQVLRSTIKKRIKTKKLITLIEKAIANPTVPIKLKKNDKFKLNGSGVPQGLSISNTLAEIYLQDFERNMNSGAFDCICFRYVDDILILCNSADISDLKKHTYSLLEEDLKLTINHTKSNEGIISDGIEYLGYKTYRCNKTNTWKFTVRDSAKMKFEASIIAEFAKYKYGHLTNKEFIFYLNNKITGVISKKFDNDNEKKYGWLFFYSQIDNITLLYELDNLIDKLIKQNNVKRKIGDLEIKEFSKSFYEITQNRTKSKYIFKPDKLSFEERKKLLSSVFDVNRYKLSNEELVEKIFYSKVYKPLKELEKDTQNFS